MRERSADDDTPPSRKSAPPPLKGEDFQRKLVLKAVHPIALVYRGPELVEGLPPLIWLTRVEKHPFDKLRDTEWTDVTIETLQRAAALVGRRVQLELV